ncbi:unnamed protein product [Caretta caretta]
MESWALLYITHCLPSRLKPSLEWQHGRAPKGLLQGLWRTLTVTSQQTEICTIDGSDPVFGFRSGPPLNLKGLYARSHLSCILK